MAKLKITKTEAATGQIHDSYTSQQYINGAYVGGTGGNTGQTGRQIQGACYVTGASQQDCFIVRQKGSRAFRVQDALSNVGECRLVNKAKGSLLASEMSITITTAAPATLYASRINNKFVYDFAGNKYRYHLATADSTFVKVAYA